jgi:transposase-like protein
MTRQRRHFTAETKVALLRAHLLDKVPVSDICEKHGITVTLFYNWQKQFFENGTAAFTANDRRRKADTDAKDQKIAELQAKLQRKHEVLAELMEEQVQLKKARGELGTDSGFPTTPATKSSISSTAGPAKPALPC